MSRLCLNGSVIFLGRAAVPLHHSSDMMLTRQGNSHQAPPTGGNEAEHSGQGFIYSAGFADYLRGWCSQTLYTVSVTELFYCLVFFGALALQESSIKTSQRVDDNSKMSKMSLKKIIPHTPSVFSCSIQCPTLLLPILLLNCCYVPEFPRSEPLRSSSYWPSLQTVSPWLCSCQCPKKTVITPTRAWWVLAAILPIICRNSTIATPDANKRLTKSE